MSSTNITNFFPGGGISITFLFFLCDYNLFSIWNYVESEDVLAENVISKVVIIPYSFILANILWPIIVLPVPVIPVRKTGWSKTTDFSKNQE